MKPEWCPQDVWNVAMNEAAQYVEWLEPKPKEYAQSEHVLAVSFARALLEAEQRGRRMGMEEAAKVADSQAIEPDIDDADPYDDYEMGGRSTARHIAAAIRAKLDEVQK